MRKQKYEIVLDEMPVWYYLITPEEQEMGFGRQNPTFIKLTEAEYTAVEEVSKEFHRMQVFLEQKYRKIKNK